MSNWKVLSDEDQKQVWNFVFDRLDFKPNEKRNLINAPIPSQCFDISNFYDSGFNEDLYDQLHESAKIWFKKVSKGERMYALNWQHTCYSFDPNTTFEKDEFDEWFVPVFPNGDYLFFLTDDFRNGIFADGINFRLVIWGMEINSAAQADMPDMLVKSKSCNGIDNA